MNSSRVTARTEDKQNSTTHSTLEPTAAHVFGWIKVCANSSTHVQQPLVDANEGVFSGGKDRVAPFGERRDEVPYKSPQVP